MRTFLVAIFLLISFVNYGQNEPQLAEKYFREGEFKKATQLYQNLHSKNPYNTTYLKRLITCYQETNLFNVAEDVLKQKLAKNPQSCLFKC